MISVCRCPRGHTWTPPSAATARTCPVCGDTALPADDGVTGDFIAPVSGDTPRAVGEQTQAFPAAPRPDPSFSSLAGTREASAVDLANPGCGATVGLTPGSTDRAGPTSSLPGTDMVPGYRILQELGRGGMGVVYKAHQKNLNRPVALKMILSGEHAGPTERERFRREAEAVAALQHPNIVQIFEVGEANGHPYLVLEFVDGGSLAERLTSDPWPARDAAELVELLARAVHYAHDHGIVHRDLKPGNVLLTGDRGQGTGDRGQETGDSKRGAASGASLSPASRLLSPKITDFGLAKRLDGSDADKATKTGAVVGTPGYIAPEQASGKGSEVGAGADVYALGAILYECLTGRPPFRGETPLDTVLQVMHDDPVPPKRLRSSVPNDLETICLKCLAKSPAKRYASASALADDLRRFLNGEPIWARPVSAWARAVKWAVRHPALAVLGVSTVVATVALLVVLSTAYARVHDAMTQKAVEAANAERERQEAEAARAEAERQKKLAQDLAAEIDQRRQAAVGQAEQLQRQAEQLLREGERQKRTSYALQLTQIAALCERDPKRALQILDDPVRCPAELRDFTWEYLHRLCHREELVYKDHGGKWLGAVAYAPGGALVATAADRQIRLWDPRTGRTAAVLDSHTGPVNGLAFGPDGRLLASAGVDGTVRLWEIPVEVLETARKTMSAVPILQQLVNPARLLPLVTLAVPNAGAAVCAAFDPHGRALATGWGDGRVRWWDVGALRPSPVEMAAGGGPAAAARSRQPRGTRPVLEFDAFPGSAKGLVRGVAFDPTGKLLACGGDRGHVHVWSAGLWSDGSARTGWPISGFVGQVNALAFSPDGRYLAATGAPRPTATSVIRLISTETWLDEHRLIGHAGPVNGLAFSHDSQFLASAGGDRTVRLWVVDDGREQSVLTGHTGPVVGVAFGPDRRSLVSGGMDGTARVWLTMIRPNESAELAEFGGLLASAATSDTGGLFLFAGESGQVQVRLRNALPGRTVSQSGVLHLWPVPVEAPPKANVRVAAVGPNGQAAFGATPTGILVWRVFQLGTRGLGNGAQLSLPVVKPGWLPTAKPVHALAVSPDGRTLAALDADGVRVWPVTAAALGVGHGDPPPESRLILPVTGARHLAFHPRGNLLAVTVGKAVRVIDLSGKVVAESADAHPARVEAVSFDWTGGLLATADAEGLVQVWKLDAGTLTLQARMPGHLGAVNGLSFAPDGKTLASGGADRSVVLWDPITGQERAVLSGHADQVIRVQFTHTPEGAALVTVGRDGSVKRWRAETHRPAPPAGPKKAAAAGKKGAPEPSAIFRVLSPVPPTPR